MKYLRLLSYYLGQGLRRWWRIILSTLLRSFSASSCVHHSAVWLAHVWLVVLSRSLLTNCAYQMSKTIHTHIIVIPLHHTSIEIVRNRHNALNTREQWFFRFKPNITSRFIQVTWA